MLLVWAAVLERVTGRTIVVCWQLSMVGELGEGSGGGGRGGGGGSGGMRRRGVRRDSIRLVLIRSKVLG